MESIKTGKLIAQARHEKNMTQKELAELLHVTDRAVSKWERGLSFPDVSLLEPLSDALEVTITELIDGERADQKVDEHTVIEVSQLATTALQKKTKRARWLGAALCAIVLILLGVGVYRLWNVSTHPARANTLRQIDLTAKEASILRLSNRCTVKYRYTLTEDVKTARAIYQVWTAEGVVSEGEFWQHGTDGRPLSYRGEMHVSFMAFQNPDKDEPPQVQISWGLPDFAEIGASAELPFRTSGVTLYAARDAHGAVKENSIPLLALEYKTVTSTLVGELDKLVAYVNTAQRGDAPPVAEGGYTLVVWLEIGRSA